MGELSLFVLGFMFFSRFVDRREFYFVVVIWIDMLLLKYVWVFWIFDVKLVLEIVVFVEI